MSKKDFKAIIAVYGTLRKGQSNHYNIKGAKHLGTFQSEPDFIMRAIGGLSYPGIKRKGHTSVTFEVYEINNKDMLEAVDSLEGFVSDGYQHNHYNRFDIETPWGKAIAYEYNRKFSTRHELIDNGDWVDFHSSRKIKNYA